MKSLSRPLHYNENKVRKGDAALVLAENFLQEKEDLTIPEKINGFQKLMQLNARTEKKVVHISLNFSPKDKLDQSQLIRIAEEYMEKLGFGDQPYLVYQHFDAAHQHLHIVSTLIIPDGKRIPTHLIESTKSFRLCRELEQKYRLVVASKNVEVLNNILIRNPLKVIYGKEETKEGIARVLNAVLDTYLYSSLAELNAVLKLYSVIADRGLVDGKIFKTRGLYYRVLDDKATIVGKPIKASSIRGKPTLDYLEQKFLDNRLKKSPFKARIRNLIDWHFKKDSGITLSELIQRLKQEQVHLVLRQNDQHLIYGITYVDVKNKVVFNGRDLGKSYSAKRILERVGEQQLTIPLVVKIVAPARYVAEKHTMGEKNKIDHQPHSDRADTRSPSKIYPVQYLPYELRRTKKRKKRRF